MTPEQAAAYINAQTALFLCELEGLKARNATRAAFDELGERWSTTLGHNALMIFFRQVNHD